MRDMGPPCPPGSFSFTGQQGCVACGARCKQQTYPVGCGAAGKAGVCVDCAQGTYEEWVGRAVCKHCPAGKRQDRKQYYMCNAIRAPTPPPTPEPTPAPPTPPPAPSNCTDAHWEVGVDYQGHNTVHGKGASPADCCAQCARTAGCLYFSLKDDTCYFKDKITGRVSDAEVTSGTVHRK